MDNELSINTRAEEGSTAVPGTTSSELGLRCIELCGDIYEPGMATLGAYKRTLAGVDHCALCLFWSFK
jgi:hypothetical protein